MAFPWDAITGGVGSVISQYMAGRQQKSNIQRTNQANINLANLRYKNDKEMAKYAYDKNLEMWELQNRYNSPASQMARFEKAGLNKNMIYGLGSPGNATGTPTYAPPSYQPPNIDYRGTPSEVANVLGSITGATRDMIEIQQKKEQLKQAEIQTWLNDTTKEDKAWTAEQLMQKSFWQAKNELISSRINSIKESFWKKGISPSDATWMRVLVRIIQEFPLPDNINKLLNSLAPDLKDVIGWSKKMKPKQNQK